MIDPTVIAIIAGCCTTGAYLPQLIKAWKTKETKDLSLVMLIVLFTGVFLWMIYGMFINDFSIIYFNALGAFFIFLLICLKFIYRK